MPAIAIHPELGDNIAGLVVGGIELHRELVANEVVRLGTGDGGDGCCDRCGDGWFGVVDGPGAAAVCT
jgi:hypothetical protein